MRWSELSPALSVREYVFLNVADLDQNYVSTMRTPSVRDLEWHKGKKTRHRRRLSLLAIVELTTILGTMLSASTVDAITLSLSTISAATISP